jgi:RNA polymerase sigma-70 factor (ECF subfamily)
MWVMDERFSQIDTAWSIVQRAHNDGITEAGQAQQELLDRYGGAVKRYALAALRNEDAANDVFQEFALKFVRGDLAGADPAKGRFRSFLKTIVYRLIVDYQRRQKKLGREVVMQTNLAGQEPTVHHTEDELFVASWRDELLSRCWAALEAQEEKTGKPYFTVLRHRVDHPDLRSPELAEGLAVKLGKPMTAGNLRVLLHRAREQFGELLLDEVLNSLADNSLNQLEEELIELELLEYCRPALEKRRDS